MHGCGDSAGDICRSVSREKSATFRREGSAIGNYFNRKEGFTEPWEQAGFRPMRSRISSPW